MRTSTHLLLLAASTLSAASLAQAAPCTDGMSCYCDRLSEPADPIHAPNVLVCEDFEAPTLYENTGKGSTSYPWGPWYDDTLVSGGEPFYDLAPGNRGQNSYWRREWAIGGGQGDSRWASGTPVAPSNGTACSVDAVCTGLVPWLGSNFSDGNSLNPKLGIYVADADFTAEVPTLSVPTGTADGGDGVFDGNANWVYRMPPGAKVGFLGTRNFATTRNIGITYAIAFPTNIAQDNLLTANWKFWEFNCPTAGSAGDCQNGLAGFGNAGDAQTSFPFYGFITDINSRSDCTAAMAGATVHAGQILECTTRGLAWKADASYSRARDWPWGEWGCIRSHINFSDLTNGSIQQWVYTPTLGKETLVVHVSGIDGNHLYPPAAGGGWNSVSPNSYANANQGLGEGDGPTTTLTFRYEDNWTITNGTPVSCAQIGFGKVDPGPAPPKNLKIM